MLFFSFFLNWVKYERNSGIKFFFLFLGLSHPVLANSNVGKRFFIILNFFAIFFQNFLNRVGYERNSGLKYFYLFLGLSHLVLGRNNTGKRFFNFFNFFAIFFGISSPGSSMNGIRD